MPFGSESGDSRPILLSYDEFMRLLSVIDVTSFRHGRQWMALRDLHPFSTQCTGAIHRRLAPTEAQKWAEASEYFSKILEHRPLSLADGIWTVYDWIGELRWYMKAMGDEQLLPIPDGQFPTPTSPSRETSTRHRAVAAEPTSAGPDSSPSFQAKPGSPDAKLTPPQLARHLSVSPEKIHAWIRSGELRAVNIATNPKGRRRYVIDPADVEAFEARRSIHKTLSAPRRRKRTSDDVIEFF
ncbi:MAG TPA: helix-turn-helix domain-containing protein [Thermoguttaceae bacterium]|nr:helix-turn-helix domain-containing protein [Thermoguttaceae bacterium]